MLEIIQLHPAHLFWLKFLLLLVVFFFAPSSWAFAVGGGGGFLKGAHHHTAHHSPASSNAASGASYTHDHGPQMFSRPSFSGGDGGLQIMLPQVPDNLMESIPDAARRAKVAMRLASIKAHPVKKHVKHASGEML